jgi:hypothetical protein
VSRKTSGREKKPALYPGDVPMFTAIEHERVILGSQKLYRERNRLAFALQLLIDDLPGARKRAVDALRETYSEKQRATMKRWSREFMEGYPSMDAREALLG